MFNRKNKYKLLKKEIEELKEKNYDLDRIIQMYEKYSKLSTKEMIDASDTISAHEEVSNFSRSEMINLVETVSAEKLQLCKNELQKLHKSVKVTFIDNKNY